MQRKTQDPRIAEKVIEMVAAHYKTTPEALKSEGGDRTARQVVMYILKDELGGTLRIAREAINVKSDMTVYVASRTVKALLKSDSALATKIEEIKTEALMIAAVPGGSTTEPPGAPVAPVQRRKNSKKDRAVSTGSSEKNTHIIERVQRAVTSIFLGSDLLQSSDPAAEVLLAKDAVVFLVWKDFPEVSQAEILSSCHLDEKGFHRAVGRISVDLKEGVSGLKKKLKAARDAYSLD